MKQIIFIFIGLLIINKCISQTIPSQEKIEGVWEFNNTKKGDDPNFIIFKGNKIIEITYWNTSKEASVYGSPYSYYGFWDDISGRYPKRISELKSFGKRVLFYDDIGKSHDSLENLIKYTRSCYLTYSVEGDDEQEMPPSYIPNKLYMNFRGKNSDIYERVKIIPLFVLESLRKNKVDWYKYGLFVGFKKVKNKIFGCLTIFVD